MRAVSHPGLAFNVASTKEFIMEMRQKVSAPILLDDLDCLATDLLIAGKLFGIYCIIEILYVSFQFLALRQCRVVARHMGSNHLVDLSL